MSRYRDCNRALNGVTVFMNNNGLETGKDFKSEIKLINDFCRHKKFQGSQTTKILYVSQNFKDFREFSLKK